MTSGVLSTAWSAFDTALPVETSMYERKQYRRAFYAGAQSLLSGMVGTLDASGNPTEVNVRAMIAIWRRDRVVL